MIRFAWRSCVIYVTSFHVGFGTTTLCSDDYKVDGRCQCFPNAIPPSQRLNITHGGLSMPIGLTCGNWDSARLMKMWYAILLEEVIGFNAKHQSECYSLSKLPLYVAGCADCGFGECPPGDSSEVHIMFEFWDNYAGWVFPWAFAGMEERTPTIMSPHAYPAKDGLWLFENTIQPSAADIGVNIIYYQDFTLKWHNVSKYFNNIFDYDWSRFTTCDSSDNSKAVDQSRMDTYIRYFGDDSYFVEVDGVRIWNCYQSIWWLGPACRDSPYDCAPITTNSGWGWEEFVHKVTAFGVPAAIGNTKTWGDFVELPGKFKSMTYWWYPDATFLSLLPSRFIGTPYNSHEWSKGYLISNSANIPVWPIAWKYLKKRCPRCFELGNRIAVFGGEMDTLLTDMVAMSAKEAAGEVETGKASVFDFACGWMKANPERWPAWVPSPTECDPSLGYGMVDESGSFVPNRETAVECKLCLPGSFASRIEDAEGPTSICVDCPAGYFQDKGAQTECMMCSSGTYNAKTSSRRCENCERGTYQSEAGATFCEECPSQMTTQSLRSVSKDDCLCGANSYRPCRDPDKGGALREGCDCSESMYISSPSSRCLECPEGMICREGSDELFYPCNAAEAANRSSQSRRLGLPEEYPLPKQRYYADYSAPASVFLCRSVEDCPGRGFDICGPGMVGNACGTCEPGWYKSNGECVQCEAWTMNPAFLLSPVLVTPFVVFVLYKTSRDGIEKWGHPRQGLGAAGYLTLVFFQTTAVVVGTLPVLPELMGGFTILDQTSEVTALFPLACAGPQDFPARFILNLLVPTFLGILFFLTAKASLLIPMVAMDGDIVSACYGGVIKTFFISICTLCCSLFQCYPHPNGEWSMKSAPSMLRGSDEWNFLVGFAVVALLVNCVGVLVVFSWAMWKAPFCFHQVRFRRRWKFLFAKLRTAVYWWMLPMLIKGLLLALTSVIFERAINQSLWVSTILLTYLLASFGLLPWRNIVVSTLDVIYHVVLLAGCLCTPFLVTWTAEERQFASGFFAAAAAATFFCVAAGYAAVLSMVRGPVKKKNEERCQSLAERMVRVCANLSEPRLLAEMMATIPGYENMILQQTHDVLSCEFLATKRFYRLQWKTDEHAEVQRPPPAQDVLNQTQSCWT